MENARAVLANHPGMKWCVSVCERTISSTAAWTAAVAWPLTLALALSLALTFSLTLALSTTGSLALALAGAITDSAIRADSVVFLLALFLAGGALRIRFRRSAESASAAALASLSEGGACSQKRDGDECADACGFHDDDWMLVWCFPDRRAFNGMEPRADELSPRSRITELSEF